MSGGDGVRIRELAGIDEFRRAVAFQESIWGEGFSERVPASLMKVTRRLGGVVAGAFGSEEELVGFVYGMTGLEEGGPVHWSDILAVRPGLRDRGVGRRLKHFQRERVLGLGVDLMRWTFDPLESRNAYLNLGHLGAVVREYAVDMYGESDSPLHRGLGTDRYVVSWELTSNRVRDRVAGVRPPPA
ncbi:MAG: GNAT family N-acetyltransferase, partial [Gemmatimonadota bacterium]